MKVIYIMGAGHIGSTVLDIVLGSHAEIESLGEISKFHRYAWTLDNNRKCSCGAPVYECPFWSQVRQAWSESLGSPDVKRFMALQNKFELSASGWARLLWNRYFPSTEFAEYLRGTAALLQAIEQVGGRQVMVDSSLTPRRAYALSMTPGVDLYLIHLVRDGRGVIWSLMKPGKQTLTKVYVPAPSSRTTRYWLSANLQSLWVFNRLNEAKRQLVRYEDFATDPQAALTKIGNWVGVDLSNVITNSGLTNPDKARHTPAGNRVRMQKDIQIRADFAWKELLPHKDRQTFWRMAGWLARKFGYSQQ